MKIEIGGRVKVTRGCLLHGLRKGDTGQVLHIKENGPAFGHSVSVRLDFGKSVQTFQARHRNRLSDSGGCIMHKGDPTYSIRVQATAPAPAPRVLGVDIAAGPDHTGVAFSEVRDGQAVLTDVLTPDEVALAQKLGALTADRAKLVIRGAAVFRQVW